ncbi:MAG: DUF1553 domain-containing protein [Planctomycetaceae bacterium]|nr:DUF1553 domain-containing protein [Planctomycetaceae bacterium]
MCTSAYRRIVSLLVVFALSTSALAAEPVDFSRDVLPVLSDRCFHCHGPDESNRQADLRLDLMESATQLGAVVPSDPDASEMIARVMSSDPDLRMPPPDSNRKPLSDDEITILRKWIEQGATWGQHWAFEKPLRPKLPNEKLHPIDSFVVAKLSKEGLSLSDRAPNATLFRRVSFDLTGLPPAQSPPAGLSSEAYQEHIERLFSSPHYGERMAMWWLDAARYSDTDGYQADATRTNWPWRDWVIQSFNDNLPFDQFTIEQFAGDLLPDATAEQQLATCFHRNHMTNGEGGRDPEESRVDYVRDRVNTTGSVWLGLTLGCSQCHSHKFDPISQSDYYSLTAFFNSIDEDGKAGGGAKPYLKYKSPHAQRVIDDAQQLVKQRTSVEEQAKEAARREFSPWLVKQCEQVTSGFQPWTTLIPRVQESIEGSVLTQEDNGVIQVSGPNPRQDDYRMTAPTKLPRVTGVRLEVLPHASHTEGKLSRGASGEFVLTDVKLQVRTKGQSQLRDVELAFAVADAEKTAKGRNYGNVRDTLDDDPRNGWTTETHDARQPHVAVFALADPLVLQPNEELIFVMLHRSTRGDANIGRFRLAVTDQPGKAVRSLAPMALQDLAETVAKPTSIPDPLRTRLFEQFLTDHHGYQTAKASLDRAQNQLSVFQRAAKEVNVMVLAERESPRSTHVLERGVWDQKGDEVRPDVLKTIYPRPQEGRQTRLDLAHWLVSHDNPLTARVVVNQLWQLCFGAGIVRTPEDFGLQGELPTHPKLLDWLAVELMEHDWDLQHILQLIVTSETYCQSSHVRPELLELDPENKLLARSARFRLPSWMIRDAALQASGLLNSDLGGPPVMPYQPDGVWAEMFMGRFRYQPSQGSAQYRRSLYAFWRRSAAPTFLFDSSQRRVCEVRPRRTNTPLHALTLLNDLSMLEASRALARTAVNRQPDAEARLDFIFASIVTRTATETEAQILNRELLRAIEFYQAKPDEAKRFLEFGQPEQQVTSNPAELAAYTVLASLVFNLDEAITHE